MLDGFAVPAFRRGRGAIVPASGICRCCAVGFRPVCRRGFLPADHGDELLFGNDLHAQLLGFPELRRAHVVARHDVIDVGRYGREVPAPVHFDQLLHFVAAARELARHHETAACERLRRQLPRLLLELQPRGTQAADDGVVLLVGEILDDRVGDAPAHLVGLGQLLARGPHHGVERAEMLREVFGRRLAHEADAESEQHAAEGHLDRSADAAYDVVGRLLAQPRQFRQLSGLQVVEVGHVVHQPVFIEQFHGLLAQPFDVHRLAADEMDDAADDLRRASPLVGAVVLRLALVAHQRRAAFGAYGDVFERFAVRRPLREVYPRDLGDDLAALLDVYHVARADVQQGHLLGVVQRRTPHGRPGQQHRFEVRHRRYGSRASHLERHAVQPRERLLGLELVGHGPFRGLGRESQLPPYGEVVDLDHHAVGREGQGMAPLVPMRDVGVDLLRSAAYARRVRDFESPLAGFLQAFPVVREGQVVARQLVERAVQAAACDHRRRLLLERPRRGVARVCEERLPGRLALGVDFVERGVGHQDLAPYFEVGRPVVAPQAQGNRAHRTYVGRHVVALRAVAARHGTQQPPVLVGERYGRAVEFQFADELRWPCLLFDAGDEFMQFVERIGVAERKHREPVLYAPELRRDVAPDTHRGRIGVGQFGVRPFQILQFAHHRVEFEVGDLRGVFDVISEVMVLELPPQLFDSLAYHNISITCVKVRILFITSCKFKKNAKKKLRMWCDM